MGGCAGTHQLPTTECCAKALAEQPVSLSPTSRTPQSQGGSTGTRGSQAQSRVPPLFLGVAVCQEDSTDSKTEVYLGVPESNKAKDSLLSPSQVSFGVTEDMGQPAEKELVLTPSKMIRFSLPEDPKQEKAVLDHPRTLLEDIGRAQGRNSAPKLPIVPRSKSQQEEIDIPPVPRAKSAPVMLPAAAVRSRSLPRLDNDTAEGSPSPMAYALPAAKSPTTALAPSRRRKRRSVTFGEAECKEFMVEACGEGAA